MDGFVIVPLSHCNTACAFLKYNNTVAIAIHPQNITHLYVLKRKTAVFDWPCRQIAECLITKVESKGHTANRTICPINSSSIPFIGTAKVPLTSIGFKIRPCRSLPKTILILQGNHSIINLWRGRDRSITGCQLGQGFLHEKLLFRQKIFRRIRNHIFISI